MQPTVEILLIGALIATTAYSTAVPADWQEGYRRGSLFFNDAPVSDDLKGSVGNGYVATSVDSDTVYVSGLFNGAGAAAPSHRARIPSPFSIAVGAASAPVPPTDALWLRQFYSEDRGDHSLCATQDASVCPSDSGAYQEERLEAACLTHPSADTLPLNFFWSARSLDNVASTNSSMEGYTLVRVMCHLKRSPAPGLVPLFLLYDPVTKDHVTVASEEGHREALSLGFQPQGIQGYAMRANVTVTATQYYSSDRQDSVLCTDAASTVCPGGSYSIVRREFECAQSPSSSANVALNLFWNEQTADNANLATDMPPKCSSLIRPTCYLSSKATTVYPIAVEAFYSTARSDHLTVASDDGRAYAREHNYTSLGIQGYAQAPPMEPIEAMNVLTGIFTRRLDYGGAHVEQRMYAHRALSHLLVHEITVNASALSSTQVHIPLTVNTGSPSTDLALSTVHHDDSQTVWFGFIRAREESKSVLQSVCVTFSTVPSNVTVASGETRTFVYFTSVATNIDIQGRVLDNATVINNAMAHFKEAQAMEVNALRERHESAWKELWEDGRIEVEGDVVLSRALWGSMYYIMTSVREDWPQGLSPGGLASDAYNGHTFWDQETWMYPPLMYLFTNTLARSCLQYRIDRLQSAIAKAHSFGWAGAMFPWESAVTGADVCPASAPESKYEQHISGDISFAFQQTWQLTHNETFLRESVPLIMGIAQFWANRVSLNAETHKYHITRVQPPDEYHYPVDDSFFTNTVAQQSLRFGASLPSLLPTLNLTVPANWTDIANGLYFPFDSDRQYHPEYASYVYGVKVKQADVILTGFPLMTNISKTVRLNDLNAYLDHTDKNGPAMTWAMFMIGYMDLHEDAQAAALLPRSYANVQQPFQVWFETPTGGAKNFITGAGGFIQGILSGYAGIRVTEKFLSINFRSLPGDTALNLTVHGVEYRGFSLSVSGSRATVSSSLTVVLTLMSLPSSSTASHLVVVDQTGASTPLKVSVPLVLPSGPVEVVEIK